MARYFNPVVTFRMADGSEHTVQTVNPDILRWERDRKRLKYDAEEDKFTMMTFLGWAAAKREKILPDMSWEVFQDECHGVTTDEAEAVDPTRLGADPE